MDVHDLLTSVAGLIEEQRSFTDAASTPPRRRAPLPAARGLGIAEMAAGDVIAARTSEVLIGLAASQNSKQALADTAGQPNHYMKRDARDNDDNGGLPDAPCSGESSAI